MFGFLNPGYTAYVIDGTVSEPGSRLRRTPAVTGELSGQLPSFTAAATRQHRRPTPPLASCR